MKKFIVLSFVIFQFAGFLSAQSDDITSTYTPTKREWLSIQLNQEYNTFCIRSGSRFNIDFTVMNTYIDIYLDFEKKVSSKEEEKVKNDITNITHKVLDKYSWSRDLLIRIKAGGE